MKPEKKKIRNEIKIFGKEEEENARENTPVVRSGPQ
jgi:hypothetical protein